MNERAIFIEALDRESPADRAAYLAEACAGDSALRQRVEELLRSHAEAGEFPGKLAPQRLADEFAAGASDDTRTEPLAPDTDEELNFLEPSDKAGVIGRLGHYDVQEVVGRGGMGIVVKAFDEHLHRVVAIKVMAPQLATSATARRRFIREARAAAAVTHDHVVTIHAVEDAGPLPRIVMQFVAGNSLQDRLDRTGPLPLPEILRIGMQTAAGLAAAHAQGLVHRDVKPSNILLENGVERVKLTDFGLARAADDASLTQSGAVAGTPAYMSPEQAEGKSLDHRSDLFSLGSVLYAMCTGGPPFRATSSMATLKRVCEDTPTPIRETNPEIPEWLVEFIAKLHAKDPADRFQTAAEVAEQMGRRLAHVQRPSVVPLPSTPSYVSVPGRSVAATGNEPARRRHRWAVAAAVLVALVATLGAAEVAGVTNIKATVIRIMTPDGALVVETDDPAVKLVVEGDGDLVITGTGAQEVRLRAGSYRLKATKDGKPVKLDRDLVTITRGDKQIVRVRLEGDAPAAAVAIVERGAFVLLGGKGGSERKFDTLAEAVRSASDGDTIEVRGNGPFVTEPIKIVLPLTMRAGDGFRPVIKLNPQEPQAHPYLLHAEAALVLEGLELHRIIPKHRKESEAWPDILVSSKNLYVANCRFLMKAEPGSPIHACVDGRSPVAELRNCEFLCQQAVGNGIDWLVFQPGQRLVIDNCLLTQSARPGSHPQFIAKGALVQLTRNTFRTREMVFWFEQGFDKVPSPKDVDQRVKLNRIDTSANIFDASFVFQFDHNLPEKLFPPREAARHVTHMLGWEGERNLYAVDGPFAAIEPATPVKDLADWRKFWATAEANSIEGRVRYQGGDLLAMLKAAPEKLTPEDFRLRSDSAGYRAGKDGRDLGADVDLVGPGPAYERWKKTPEYQQWLKETGQNK